MVVSLWDMTIRAKMGHLTEQVMSSLPVFAALAAKNPLRAGPRPCATEIRVAGTSRRLPFLHGRGESKKVNRLKDLIWLSRHFGERSSSAETFEIFHPLQRQFLEGSLWLNNIRFTKMAGDPTGCATRY
jgi:hypothetical protein